MLKRNKMQENKRKGQPKGQKKKKKKKKEKKRIARQHKLNWEKREKFFNNSRELFLSPEVFAKSLYL